MAKRFFLIDAHSHIYRAYYAIRGLSASDGLPTNAIFGFTSMLLKLLREEQPDYMVVAFDSPGPTRRHEQYDAYKAQRKAMPDGLQLQIPLIEQIIEALGVSTVRAPGYEADDIIGTLARRASGDGVEVLICTTDKDALQLLDEHTCRYETKTGECYTADRLREEMHIEPPQVIDVMGLSGDASDNVPGVEGVGPKTALELVQRFGSLEAVIEHADQIKQTKRRERLLAQADQARLSKSLVTVDTHMPLDVTLQSCRVCEPDVPKLKEIFRRLEFNKLLAQLEKASPAAATDEQADYRLVDSARRFERFFGELSQRDQFAFDIETTSISPMDAKIVGLSFSWQQGQGWYVALKAPGGKRPLPTRPTLERLKPILEDPSVHKLGQNLKYDLLVLRNAGIELRGISFDSMIASYLLNPSRRRHNLDELADQFLGIKKTPISDLIGTGKDQITMDQVDAERVCAYACEDAACAWRLAQVMLPELRRHGLDTLLGDVELPLLEVLAEMEFNGVKIDTAVLAELSGRVAEMMASLEQKIHELAGGRFNIGSPKQLSQVLYEQLKLPKPRRTSLGYSTRADVLEDLARHHELPARVLEYRQLAKLRSTYLEALPKMVHARTGKIHTSFNQTTTATGRLSSSDPNLQNIPIRTELGRSIRKAFVPSSRNWAILSADYSQVELRILAHLSEDPALTKAFHDGLDIHAFVAAEVHGVELDDVDSQMRQGAKAVNFGIVYGLTPFGLSRGLGISVQQAEQFIASYFERYARVKQYIEKVIESCRELGYVVTMLNRRRYLPTINSSNAQDRRFAERMAINTVIQGSAADLIKVAMNRIYRRLRDEQHATKIILQIHDELVFEVPKSDVLFERALIEREMSSAMELNVPIQVHIEVGDNWLEAK